MDMLHRNRAGLPKEEANTFAALQKQAEKLQLAAALLPQTCW